VKKQRPVWQNVTAPSIVNHYASGMKGTDLLDQYASYYSFDLKSKKWPRRVFNQFLLISVFNANILRFRQTQEKVVFKQAIEDLIVEMCPAIFAQPSYGVKSESDDNLSTISSHGSQESPKKKYRADDSSVSTLGSGVIAEPFHYPIKIATNPGADRSCVRRRCAYCKKRTMNFCSTCLLALCVKNPGPDNCYTLYHKEHFHTNSSV
jgi:hypothetical protein